MPAQTQEEVVYQFHVGVVVSLGGASKLRGFTWISLQSRCALG